MYAASTVVAIPSKATTDRVDVTARVRDDDSLDRSSASGYALGPLITGPILP